MSIGSAIGTAIDLIISLGCISIIFLTGLISGFVVGQFQLLPIKRLLTFLGNYGMKKGAERCFGTNTNPFIVHPIIPDDKLNGAFNPNNPFGINQMRNRVDNPATVPVIRKDLVNETKLVPDYQDLCVD